jgi:ATP-dependent helicase HrpA
VPELDKQTLWFSTVGNAEMLQQDLERAVLLAAFLPNDANVRDAESFERRLNRGKQMLVQLAATTGGSSFEALRAYQELSRLLKAPVSPQLLPAMAEVREQVQQLIYPGFISGSPTKWLPHVARYLRAAIQRLEKLPGNLERDASRAAVVRRYWRAYEQARTGRAHEDRLTEFRWMIEELRVSLFAQELGTSVKVSPERLDRLWKELN